MSLSTILRRATSQNREPLKQVLLTTCLEAINALRLDQFTVATMFHLETKQRKLTSSYPHDHATPRGGPYATSVLLESFC